MKQAGVATLISEQAEVKQNLFFLEKKNEEGYFLLIKGKIQKEKITIVNILAHLIL